MTTTQDLTAEQHALMMLRRHQRDMTRPDFPHIADESALEPREVQKMWEALLAGKSPQPTGYRAPGRVAPPTTVAEAAAQPDRWRAAIGHPVKRIARKAERVVALIAEVESDLDADGERGKLRQREQRLAAELAKVRAELRGGTPKPGGAPVDVERVQCDCGDMVRADRISQHRGRSAKHR